MSEPCNTCAANWLVEACDLRTGIVRAIWQPINMRFDIGLNTVTDGAVTLATRSIALRDVWPGLTSVYISRITGADATRENPVCEFAGIVTDMGASESGATMIGLKSIDWYLHMRTIKRTLTFDEVEQTEIAAALVDEIHIVDAGSGAIPLTSQAEASNVSRDRVYNSWDRKNIGEALVDLTQVVNGPDWELIHTRGQGVWSSVIIFRDYVGEDRGISLRSDREASAYSVSLDARSIANYVDAFGAGDGADQLIETAIDEDSIYPQFDATAAWTDVSVPNTLAQHAGGYIDANKEPEALPTVTLPGLGVEPMSLQIGDTVDVSIEYGAISYTGSARVITIAWEVGDGKPEMRTLELVPLVRASESMLGQSPAALNCEDC